MTIERNACGELPTNPEPVGLIHAAMSRAVSVVKSVKKEKQKTTDKFAFQEADAVIAAAKQALSDAGILYSITCMLPVVTPTETHATGGLITLYIVEAILTVMHPEDGSTIEYRATGTTPVNNMGKFGPAANTSARKAVMMMALVITTGANDPWAPSEEFVFMEDKIESCTSALELRAVVTMDRYKELKKDPRAAELLIAIGKNHLANLRARLPEDVEEIIATIEACQTADEIKAVTAREKYKALRGGHRGHVGAILEARRKSLFLMSKTK